MDYKNKIIGKAWSMLADIETKTINALYNPYSDLLPDRYFGGDKCYRKTNLTNKQRKAREANKRAKKARKRNR